MHSLTNKQLEKRIFSIILCQFLSQIDTLSIFSNYFLNEMAIVYPDDPT